MMNFLVFSGPTEAYSSTFTWRQTIKLMTLKWAVCRMQMHRTHYLPFKWISDHVCYCISDNLKTINKQQTRQWKKPWEPDDAGKTAVRRMPKCSIARRTLYRPLVPQRKPRPALPRAARAPSVAGFFLIRSIIPYYTLCLRCLSNLTRVLIDVTALLYYWRY